MYTKLFLFSIIILSITVILSSIRAIRGPRSSDRLVAINVICTKTVVIISIISFILKETYFIDVVLVYALIGFIATVVISRFLEICAKTNK